MKHIIIALLILAGCKAEAQNIKVGPGTWTDIMPPSLPDRDTCRALILVSDTCHFSMAVTYARRAVMIRKRFTTPYNKAGYMVDVQLLAPDFKLFGPCFFIWNIQLINAPTYQPIGL